MRIERGVQQPNSALKRKVTLPGGEVRHTDVDPKEIATIITSRSKRARTEAKLDARR